MENNIKSYIQGAYETQAIMQDGYRLIGRLSDNEGELIYVLRHANGNQMKVTITATEVFVYKNGKVKKHLLF